MVPGMIPRTPPPSMLSTVTMLPHAAAGDLGVHDADAMGTASIKGWLRLASSSSNRQPATTTDLRPWASRASVVRTRAKQRLVVLFVRCLLGLPFVCLSLAVLCSGGARALALYIRKAAGRGARNGADGKGVGGYGTGRRVEGSNVEGANARASRAEQQPSPSEAPSTRWRGDDHPLSDRPGWVSHMRSGTAHSYRKSYCNICIGVELVE